MTNDRFKSAMHRVYNHTAVDRYSTALFIEVCSCSPSHQRKRQEALTSTSAQWWSPHPCHSSVTASYKSLMVPEGSRLATAWTDLGLTLRAHG